MSQPSSNSVSRRELLIFFYKYRLRLFLSFLVPFAVACVVSTLPSPRYKAESVLIVRLGSEYVYQPEGAGNQNGQSNPIPFNQEQIFKSEVAILGSDDLHEQVINTIGLEKLYPQILHPSAYSEIKSALMHSLKDSLRKAGIPIPADAPPMPEEEAHHHQIATALEIFNSRFDILLEKESAVIDISFEHKDAAVATETLNTLLKLYFEKRKLLYTEPRAALAKDEVQSRHNRALGAAAAVEDYKRKHDIYSLETQRNELLDKRSKLQEKSANISNPSIEAKITIFNQQLDQLDAAERQLDTLQKEAQIADESYSLYAHKFDEAKAYEDLEHKRTDSVRVIQPAITPPDPKKLGPLILAAGAFISLLILCIVAAITEFSRSGFSTPEQIERGLSLPVLAVFPLRRHG